MAPCDFSVSCHFEAIEVIKAETRVVLNTGKEHDFQDCIYKNDRRSENAAYTCKGTTLRAMMASSPKGWH
jgi:hypothetical protein